MLLVGPSPVSLTIVLMVQRRTKASFSASAVLFLMTQLTDTADLQEGILMGYKKRGSEGAAVTGGCRKQPEQRRINSVSSGNIFSCLITLRTDRYYQIKHLLRVFVHRGEELSRAISASSFVLMS